MSKSKCSGPIFFLQFQMSEGNFLIYRKALLSETNSCIFQVVNLCWSHCLYDAIIYVYTRGMHDYITPLEQLLTRLGDALSTGKQLTGQTVI